MAYEVILLCSQVNKQKKREVKIYTTLFSVFAALFEAGLRFNLLTCGFIVLA